MSYMTKTLPSLVQVHLRVKPLRLQAVLVSVVNVVQSYTED